MMYLPIPATDAGTFTVTEIERKIANQTDLELNITPSPTSAILSSIPFLDGPIDGPDTEEGDLDIQYTVGIATNVPTTILSAVIGRTCATRCHDELRTRRRGLRSSKGARGYRRCSATCTYMQLGARGSSVLLLLGTVLLPWEGRQGSTLRWRSHSWPADSPRFPPAPPKYQNAAVASYLQALGETYQALYNPGGRGIPDVSAQAKGFVTARRPLGFLNPLSYSRGAAVFNDIAVGSSPSCGTLGFLASAGWDQVGSGDGSGKSDYEKLLEVVSRVS
ncbi:hypothetical protein C8Q80DRAFT_1288115 [Daedaleopsis nitida]|nr:hypothetical protein C8Q80DRAFT_1288115 [Daedaleopsis nitida]